MTVPIGYLLLILVALLTALGQVCFKKVACAESTLFKKIFNPLFWCGGIFFVCGPILSSIAAKVVDFSILYAMTSLNFVVVLCFSHCFLKERIDWPKILGVCVIVFGLLIMVME